MKETEILSGISEKLGISQLNELQTTALSDVKATSDTIIYSPTGTGKTLAYTIPILKALKNFDQEKLQAVIIAPSRELVMQIYEVIRQLAVGFKVTCTYGGHNVADEKASLQNTPSIIVSTPGRLLDHVQREHIFIGNVRQLVIDEFDKCLELGFEEEMKKLCKLMPNLSRRILTSATVLNAVPDYVRLHNASVINFLDGNEQPRERMTIWEVRSPQRDKIDSLCQLLYSIPFGKTIVFANYRDAVARIYDSLKQRNIAAGLYHGALEQIDREKAIAMFNNGSFPILITTDLGARGLDITEVKNIVHYHLPVSEDAFTHRNGRSARVNASGDIYIMIGPDELPPDYVNIDKKFTFPSQPVNNHITNTMSTIYFQAGKKEKISKGDIAGFIAHNGGVEGSDIGVINVYDHFSLAAVPAKRAKSILEKLNSCKLKGKKIRMSIAHPEARLTKNRK